MSILSYLYMYYISVFRNMCYTISIRRGLPYFRLNILIDFNGKSNFFYDNTEGFQFIDLDSHTDYKYGLVEHKLDGKEIVAYYGFTPCHFAVGTKVLPNLALDEKAISMIDDKELLQLVMDNKTIFEKCKTALYNNGISEEQLSNSLEILKLFGC